MASVDVARGRHEWLNSGAFEVAPGVHRIPLPMPGDGLRAVNVYAIEDGDGLVLVDSGWGKPEARSALESALAELGRELGDVRKFLVTHAHRDHYTLGVQLRRTLGVPVALGAGERPSLDILLAGTHDRQLSQLDRNGAAELADLIRSSLDTEAEPPGEDFERPDEWLEADTEIELTDRTLRVIPTPGHTRGHVVFVDERNSLLFAGDHVLPHITPSIGLEAARTTLPLGDYLDSLRRVRDLPDMRLLPAHGPVTDSTRTRVDELLAHHEERLDHTEGVIRHGAKTAREAAGELGWTRRDRAFADLDAFNQVLAVGETGAHLDLLVARGRLHSSITNGVARYRTT